MVKFYCDERFGGLGGLCSTGGSRCMCRGESERKERFVVRIWFNYHI